MTLKSRTGGPRVVPLGSKWLIGVFMLFSFNLNLQAPEDSYGYVLPAEQIIHFMADNASRYKTLVITQFTQQEIGQDSKGKAFKLFREKIWMQAPNRYHAELLNEDRTSREVPDVAFRRLLLADSPDNFMQLLLNMGIDLETVSYTKVDGIIAYRIGNAEPTSPKILIEKERFLPLSLSYWSLGSRAGALIDVTFQDYREVDKGWYPFEISYASDRWPDEVYTVLSILPNGPFDSSVFSSTTSGPRQERSLEEEGLSDEERLKKIIEKFEERYQ